MRGSRIVTFLTDYATEIDLIETELRRALAVPCPSLERFYGMMQYHLGWLERDFQECSEQNRGKRVRPLLVLLASKAAGGDVLQALPAAVAVELVHSFSLVHDDMEDRSDFRRHREAVWKVWGDAHAINTGDALFALSRLQLCKLPDAGVPARRVLSAMTILDEACLALTEGQFLDIHFEDAASVSLDDYLWMIRGKTAALLAAACQIGALVSTDDSEVIRALQQFGYNLGMAFQIEDDLLGIWGDPDITGKPAGDDILHRKKTLPVVFAWDRGSTPDAPESIRTVASFLLHSYAESGELSARDASRIVETLESIGAKEYCAAMSQEYTEQAMAAIAHPALKAGPAQALRALAQSLLARGF